MTSTGVPMAGWTDLFLQHGRFGEWVSSLAMAGFAFILWLPGDSFAGIPAYTVFVRNGITEQMVAVPLGFLAGVRIAALIINGRWKRSPLLRSIGAMLGFTFFGMLTLTIISPWYAGNIEAASPGIAFVAALAFADFIASHRTGADRGDLKRIDARRLEIFGVGDRSLSTGLLVEHSGEEQDSGRGGREASSGGSARLCAEGRPVYVPADRDISGPDRVDHVARSFPASRE